MFTDCRSINRSIVEAVLDPDSTSEPRAIQHRPQDASKEAGVHQAEIGPFSALNHPFTSFVRDSGG